eukprot:GHVR01009880.1.p1 GENE.GHVR01009880.1~~GHVR01009880.1.p1  ORF type:complete len:115 (+),score=23.63 GHVR01009880.1:76-420(+)
MCYIHNIIYEYNIYMCTYIYVCVHTHTHTIYIYIVLNLSLSLYIYTYSVEATIIRVMKIRKSCLHHELEDEVVRVLRCRFPPSPILIKQRIDNLITREYIERHSDDSRRYSYLA